MSIVESSAQFLGGLQNIERGIIARVREAGRDTQKPRAE
jgi:hypothetical protein